MVAPAKKASNIKPVEFYGSSLPRPRFFTNPQFNSERVDPPLPVLDPLLSWARDAHWSMGGLSFTRLRLQGRIEGKVSKLRVQLEKSSPHKRHPPSSGLRYRKNIESESPPPAPVAVKRRRLLDLNEEDEDVHSEEDEGTVRTRRKLSDDFDRVAGESKVESIRSKDDLSGSGSERKKLKKETEKGSERRSTRTSPRMVKRRSD